MDITSRINVLEIDEKEQKQQHLPSLFRQLHW